MKRSSVALPATEIKKLNRDVGVERRPGVGYAPMFLHLRSLRGGAQSVAGRRHRGPAQRWSCSRQAVRHRASGYAADAGTQFHRPPAAGTPATAKSRASVRRKYYCTIIFINIHTTKLPITVHTDPSPHICHEQCFEFERKNREKNSFIFIFMLEF